MKKRIILPLAVTAGIAIAVMVYHIGFAETKAQQKPDDLYKELELFSDAVSIIRSDYVEEKNQRILYMARSRGCWLLWTHTASSWTLILTTR